MEKEVDASSSLNPSKLKGSGVCLHVTMVSGSIFK